MCISSGSARVRAPTAAPISNSIVHTPCPASVSTLRVQLRTAHTAADPWHERYPARRSRMRLCQTQDGGSRFCSTFCSQSPCGGASPCSRPSPDMLLVRDESSAVCYRAAGVLLNRDGRLHFPVSCPAPLVRMFCGGACRSYDLEIAMWKVVQMHNRSQMHTILNRVQGYLAHKKTSTLLGPS